MKRVLLGISGGVDSSVAAVLLKEKGYTVVGITFVFTNSFNPSDAIAICKNLNIEHHVIDYKIEFKKYVIDNFKNNYLQGLTPNPCIICNKYVKFNFLYENMEKYNCDFIATGHYAKIENNALFKSADIKKDQTYFLYQLTSEQLSKTLFPLEGITKEMVRNIALKNNLVSANKKDSTDICFINNGFKNYIKENFNLKNGSIINVDTNEKIGNHSGLMQYTIGQRRGIDVGGNTDRIFVVGKNIKEDILYVALCNDNKYLLSNSCIIENINFNIKAIPNKCTAKFRYQSIEYSVNIKLLENNNILVEYDNIKSVTPGQSCVFYTNNQCIGGGIIKEVRKDNEKLWYLL